MLMFDGVCTPPDTSWTLIHKSMNELTSGQVQSIVANGSVQRLPVGRKQRDDECILFY